MIIRELVAEKIGSHVKAIGPDDTLAELARRLVFHKIGALVVTDESNSLVGIVSERDIIRAITEYGSRLIDIPVADVMTRSVVTCTPEESIVEVLDSMRAHGIRHIPVLDGGELVTVVSIRDLTRAYELNRGSPGLQYS